MFRRRREQEYVLNRSPLVYHQNHTFKVIVRLWSAGSCLEGGADGCTRTQNSERLANSVHAFPSRVPVATNNNTFKLVVEGLKGRKMY